MNSDYTSSQALPISWEQFHQDTRALAKSLADKGPFTGIVAISRGGLVPAAILAKELDIVLVRTVCITSYDGKKQHDPEVVKAIDGDGSGILVVDDIADTGATAEVVRAMLPKAHLATVYAKPKGAPHADTAAVDIKQEAWLIFPWETEDEK